MCFPEASAGWMSCCYIAFVTGAPVVTVLFVTSSLSKTGHIRGIFEHMYENVFEYGILVLTFAGCFKDKRFETTPISSPSKA